MKGDEPRRPARVPAWFLYAQTIPKTDDPDLSETRSLRVSLEFVCGNTDLTR